MLVLGFYVNKQTVQQRNAEHLVTDSTNYVKLHFDFDGNDWDNVTKRVLFSSRSSEVYCKQLDNNNDVIVPWEVLVDDSFMFELYGVGNDNLRITTNPRRVSLEYSGYTEEIGEALPATPSVLDDIYSEITKTNGNVTAVNGRVDLTNTNVSGLSTDLNQAKTSILSINSTLDQALLDIKEVSDGLKETDGTVEDIGEDITEITSDITAINNKLDNTIEMEVTFTDETTATYNVVVKPDESD